MKVIVTVYLRRVSVIDEDEDQLDASITQKYDIGQFTSLQTPPLAVTVFFVIRYFPLQFLFYNCRPFHQSTFFVCS